MKLFLGIDITENKKNEKTNDDVFVVARPSDVQKAALDKATDELINGLDKARLPKVMRIALYLSLFVTVLGAAVLAEIVADEGNTLSSVYQSIPWLFWLVGAIFIATAVLVITAVRRSKKALESEELEAAGQDSDMIIGNIFAEFGVSADAKDVELLSIKYKLKNGEVKLEKDGFAVSAETYRYKAYREEDNLIFANADAKYAFPISELRAIRTVSERLVIPFWSKDEDYNKGEYKQYKLQEGKYGDICMKTYHILEVEHNNELWAVYFPCYELPTMQELTGLAAE